MTTNELTAAQRAELRDYLKETERPMQIIDTERLRTLVDMAERCAKAERRHQESTQWYASRWERLRAEILPVGSEAEKKACDIMANGKLLTDHAPESPLALAIARAERAEAKAANMRERAERCADYDRRLSEVMPKDFKDWHQNAKAEWPEVAASTITNLRQREEWALEQMTMALAECEALRRKVEQMTNETKA